MSNIWKIGTRWSEWGNPSSSVLSIMRRNNTAFVWLDGKAKYRFLNDVKKGDYIALADGYQIVAIGKATSEAGCLKDFTNFHISELDFPDFSIEDGLDNIVAVKINIVDIDDKDKDAFYYQKQHKFCALNKLWNETKRYYEEHVNRFEIKSYTATIGKSIEDDHCLLDSKATYIVPIYQRPYEWKEVQVRPFINDILSNFMGKDGSGCLPEPMFIGTMQLSKRKPISNIEYQHEIVDGQQRITTLTIFLRELQKHFPKCNRLSLLKFNWLQTHVSDQQSEYLYNYLHTEEWELLNPYSSNANIIWGTFEDFLQNKEESFEFSIEKFCDYLFEQVCFVVIETSAGLSKTIQIFNTINNTGLDLNGSDLFKIRMYEYLHDIKFEDETIFKKIQGLYTLVDEQNKQHATEFSMGTMLEIYKNVLITEFNLSNVLYSFGWETFFDRLFDSLLGVNEWEHFKNLNGLELSLDVLKDIIEMRYEKESYNYSNLETKFATRMISDYSRYRWSKGLVMYPFLYFHHKEDDKYCQLERLIVVLNKYFFIHSIEHSRQIYQVNNFIANLVKTLKKESSKDVIDAVKKQISLENEDLLKDSIGRDLFEGSRWWKYLICGVSTYLKEREIADDKLIEKIFYTDSFDIEHIHATADESIRIPRELQNSIGNLSQLENSINRSIQNKPFSKKQESYKKSSYSLFKELAEYKEWTIENIYKRKEQEVVAIYNYIKQEEELSYGSVHI